MISSRKTESSGRFALEESYHYVHVYASNVDVYSDRRAALTDIHNSNSHYILVDRVSACFSACLFNSDFIYTNGVHIHIDITSFTESDNAIEECQFVYSASTTYNVCVPMPSSCGKSTASYDSHPEQHFLIGMPRFCWLIYCIMWLWETGGNDRRL